MKHFYVQHNIGKARHVVNYHDGAQKHPDGSDFYGCAIFSNKRKLASYVSGLRKIGYRDQGGITWSK